MPQLHNDFTKATLTISISKILVKNMLKGGLHLFHVNVKVITMVTVDAKPEIILKICSSKVMCSTWITHGSGNILKE